MCKGSPKVWNALAGGGVATGEEQVVHGGRKGMVQQCLGHAHVFAGRGEFKAEIDDAPVLGRKKNAYFECTS